MIRCDNGPENISETVRHWAKEWGIRFEYIQPGKPQQNAYVERFNRTVRYEWLSQYHWSDLEEVRLYAPDWMYNNERPNMASGGIIPKAKSGHGHLNLLLNPMLAGGLFINLSSNKRIPLGSLCRPY